MQKNTRTLSGQAMLTAILFLLAGSVAVLAGVTAPVFQEFRSLEALRYSKQSFAASESSVEDLTYRLRRGLAFSPLEVIVLGGVTATATVSASGNIQTIRAVGDAENRIRTSQVTLTTGTGASFMYGIQVGNGGFLIENSAAVNGSVYSNGSATGENSNIIRGDFVSAGPGGLIDGIHATGTAYAHTIRDATIDRDAHYTSISNTTVGGVMFSNSPDQPALPLPITDEQIEEWKSAAEAGGTYTGPCPYKKTTSGTTTIGPLKIPCDVEISGTASITVTGPVWIVGNLITQNSAKLKTSPLFQGVSIPIIVDNPLDRSGGSRITLQNSTVFDGTPSNSYFLVISQNNSAELGGSTPAIDVKNSTKGQFLAYAAHGEIQLENSISLKEVTAFRIRLKNSATVTYESGLANLLFSAGPSGGYIIQNWGEIQ